MFYSINNTPLAHFCEFYSPDLSSPTSVELPNLLQRLICFSKFENYGPSCGFWLFVPNSFFQGDRSFVIYMLVVPGSFYPVWIFLQTGVAKLLDPSTERSQLRLSFTSSTIELPLSCVPWFNKWNNELPNCLDQKSGSLP